MPGFNLPGNELSLAVLASGNGSNLQAIIDASEKKEIGSMVSVVVSDNDRAYALKRAVNHGLDTLYVNPSQYASRETFDKAIVEAVKERGVELVILAGFMRLLSPIFIKEYRGRIMNIHPSLLPAFPGLDGVKQALEYGVKISGCTVHFVDEGLDTGPIILQEAVPVYDNDTEEDLHQRIHEVEHRLYPRAIQLFAHNKLRLEGRRCFINEK